MEHMKIGDPVDIFITCYLLQAFTEKTLSYLFYRTKHPYRLFIIDQGGNDEVLEVAKDNIFLRVKMIPNAGIHAAHNVSLALAESEYFITCDNDIYAPELNPDWLTQMIAFMNERPDYAAISMHPHIFIGAVGIKPDEKEDVVERNMCGSVYRLMRREAVVKAGGWERVIRTSRNHEERTICSRLQTAGYKVGIASRIRAYHPFGDNWGYPENITPEMQGHNPELKDYVKSFDKIQAYNPKTWMPL